MSSQTICYFDNNATTRVAPEVVEAIVPASVGFAAFIPSFRVNADDSEIIS